MDYVGTELQAMELARNYHRWILSFFRPYLRGRIIEIGAGIGSFSELILSCGPEELVSIEPAENLFPLLAERMRGRPNVKIVKGLFDGEQNADAVVLVNVLEHIEDDAGMLKKVRDSLARDGRLLVFVPALPGLFGTLDREFGHFRRYTRRQLARLAAECGFAVELLRYANFPGSLAWLLAGRVFRRRTISPWAARAYDRWVLPLVRAVEGQVSPPIGQSLVLIARAGGP